MSARGITMVRGVAVETGLLEELARAHVAPLATDAEPPTATRARTAVEGALVGVGYASFANHDAEAFSAMRLGDHLGMQDQDVAELALLVEDALGVGLGDQELRACRTLGDLVEAVERALAAKARRA